VTQILAAFVAVFLLLTVSLMKSPDPARTLQGLKKPQVAHELATESVGYLVATSVIFVIVFSLVVIRLVVGRDWRRQIALRRPLPVHVGLALAGLPAIVVLGSGSYALMKQLLPDTGYFMERLGLPGAGVDEAIAQLLQLPWWFGVLVVGIGPGIGEELWCRGFLGRGMVGNYGAVAGVLFTSFWFGVIHVDPPQGAYAMLMGIVLHFSYLTTRSLWVPMLLHFGNNSLEVVAGKIPALGAVLVAPGQAPYLVYPTAALFLATVCWALYQSRVRLVAAADGGPPPWRPNYPGVELPPPGSGAVVAHRWPRWFLWVLILASGVLFVTALAQAV
jgi:membrane protease YdiL (CAAX protease family)